MEITQCNIKIMQKVREVLINSLKGSTFEIGINFKLSKSTIEPFFILESVKTSDFGTISQIKSIWSKVFAGQISFGETNGKFVKVSVLRLYDQIEQPNGKDTFSGKLLSYLESQLGRRYNYPESTRYFEVIVNLVDPKESIVTIKFQSKKFYYQTILILEQDEYYSKRFILKDELSATITESRVKDQKDVSFVTNFFTKLNHIYSQEQGTLFTIETPAILFLKELNENERAEVFLNFIRPDYLDKFLEISERISKKWDSETLGLEQISLCVTEEEMKKFSSSFIGQNIIQIDNTQADERFTFLKIEKENKSEKVATGKKEKLDIKNGKNQNVKENEMKVKSETKVVENSTIHPYEQDRSLLMKKVETAGYKLSIPKRGGSNGGIVGFSRIPYVIMQGILKINILNNDGKILTAVLGITQKYFENRPEVKVEVDQVDKKVIIYLKQADPNIKPENVKNTLVKSTKIKRSVKIEKPDSREIKKESSVNVIVHNVDPKQILNASIQSEIDISDKIDSLRKQSDEIKLKFIESVSEKFVGILYEILREENIKIFLDLTVDAGRIKYEQLPLNSLNDMVLLKIKEKLVI